MGVCLVSNVSLLCLWERMMLPRTVACARKELLILGQLFFCFLILLFSKIRGLLRFCVCVFYIMKFAQGDWFALKALFSTSESNWTADG